MILASNDTVLAAFSLVVLALGYVACFALWWFVFREKKEK